MEFLIHYTKEDFRNDIRSIVSETINQQPQPETNTPPEYETRKETAKRLHISLVTLNRLTNNGTLKSYRIGGRVLYKADETTGALTEIYKKYRR
jgi:excisionase family DNA binding protein